MIALGLLLAICWVPTVTGASIMTQWAVLSCVLPLALWKSPPAFPWLGAAFLAYAAASALWAPNIYDAGWQLWLLAIIGLSFWLGACLESLRSILIGLSLGLILSSLLCVTQYFGLDWPPHREAPAGLLYNGATLGSIVSMVVVGLVVHRQWALIPLLLPGLFLCNSRGAWLATAIGAASAFLRRPFAIGLLFLAGLFALTFSAHVSDNDRFFHWKIALGGLTWFGQGVGSFLGIMVRNQSGADVWFSPAGAAHNDYLQLAFEFGIGALPIYAIYLWALASPSHREWPIFVTFAIQGIWFFPLYLPLTAFLGSLVAGHMLSRGRLVGHVGYHGGLDGLSWRPFGESRANKSWGRNLSSLT